MAITQKDIAERLNVSVSLVSRVLSGKAAEIGIAAQTQRRIIATAEEMGYVPNAVAQTLKGASSRTIGVVVYDFADPFLGTEIDALHHEAREHEYSLVLVGFEKRRPDRRDLAPLLKHNLDGLIVLGSRAEHVWLEEFCGLPVSLIGGGSSPEGSYSLEPDDESAYQELLTPLYAKGVRSAGFAGPSTEPQCRRFESFRRAAEKCGITVTGQTDTGNGSAETAAGAFRSILASGQLPDLIATYNDVIALTGIREMHKAGIRIPDEVRIAGFDDIPLADLCTPGLTTIRQPVSEIAAKAFKSIALKPQSGTEKFAARPVFRGSA